MAKNILVGTRATAKNWLGEVNGKSIFISPEAIEGLKIELVENDWRTNGNKELAI